jgi:hypothetical protein
VIDKMTIKAKDLKLIVQDYLEYFPGWRILGFDTLYRDSEPILQGILFNRASWDVYRPTGFIRVLTSPSPKGVLQVPQPLKNLNGAPGRTIGLVNHNRNRLKIVPEIVNELRRQIEPSIDRPLDPKKVLKWYANRAILSINDAYSLAAFHAYLGFDNDARFWIREFHQWIDERKIIQDESVEEDSRFLEELENWLEKGVARSKLESIIELERKKLGIS